MAKNKFQIASFGVPLPYSNHDHEEEQPELSPEDVNKVLDRFEREFHEGEKAPKIKDLENKDLNEHLRKMYRHYFTG